MGRRGRGERGRQALTGCERGERRGEERKLEKMEGEGCSVNLSINLVYT